MTEADMQCNPVKAYENVYGKKSFNTLEISFNATAPVISMIDELANTENPGKDL